MAAGLLERLRTWPTRRPRPAAVLAMVIAGLGVPACGTLLEERQSLMGAAIALGLAAAAALVGAATFVRAALAVGGLLVLLAAATSGLDQRVLDVVNAGLVGACGVLVVLGVVRLVSPPHVPRLVAPVGRLVAGSVEVGVQVPLAVTAFVIAVFSADTWEVAGRLDVAQAMTLLVLGVGISAALARHRLGARFTGRAAVEVLAELVLLAVLLVVAFFLLGAVLVDDLLAADRLGVAPDDPGAWLSAAGEDTVLRARVVLATSFAALGVIASSAADSLLPPTLRTEPPAQPSPGGDTG